jgi:hypothetical protein
MFFKVKLVMAGSVMEPILHHTTSVRLRKDVRRRLDLSLILAGGMGSYSRPASTSRRNWTIPSTYTF